ncbi:transposase [Ereboglobus sp. PH5-5]|uniref:transposase n=1 Tax=Ereboglobus sp. PH5-5 TaxID=2940529 RepID=UPI002404D906|nr:transposase [Ereboglobus sp. PH5-5]
MRWRSRYKCSSKGDAARTEHHGLGLDGADQIRASGGCSRRLQADQSWAQKFSFACGGVGWRATLRGLPVPRQGRGEREPLERGDGGGALGKSNWFDRGDIGFGNEALMCWHEQRESAPRYLFKPKQNKNLRGAIPSIAEEAWQAPAHEGVWQTAETRVRLEGWSCERRVVVAPRRDQCELWKLARHKYTAYVSDLPEERCNGWQILALYRERANTENVFDELKNQWGFNGFCSGKKAVSALAAGMMLAAYLWSVPIRLMGRTDKHVELVKSRRWLPPIAARLVESDRQKLVSLCA